MKTVSTSSSTHSHSYLCTDTWPQVLCLPAVTKDELHLSSQSQPTHLLTDITLPTPSIFYHHFSLSIAGFLSTEEYASFRILETFLSWSQLFYHCPTFSPPLHRKNSPRIVVCICCFEFASFSVQVSHQHYSSQSALVIHAPPWDGKSPSLSQRQWGTVLSLNSRAVLSPSSLWTHSPFIEFLSPTS